MRKTYDRAVLTQMNSVKRLRRIEFEEGDITFEADDDMANLIMEQLFPDVEKEVIIRN